MSLQQGPLATQDLPCYLANALTANISVSADGYTKLVTCPAAYVNGGNQAYRPVIYVASVQFSDATASNFSFVDSNGVVLAGAFQNVGTFSAWFNGLLSTNPSAVGADFGINFVTPPAAPIGVLVTYWTT